jgi:hypothetical protein
MSTRQAVLSRKTGKYEPIRTINDLPGDFYPFCQTELAIDPFFELTGKAPAG